MSSILSLKNVSKHFDDRPNERMLALRDIDLEIYTGDFFVFLGPSGCGKSTLLRIMSGLEKKYEGGVVLASGITRADFGFVFQQFALLPWLNVFQNIELPLVARKLSEADRHERVIRELGQFGLEKFAHHYPHELSGGMRQRVGIARALVADPKVVFMDEAFSELDSFTAEELRKELLQVWAERNMTIVMVTHIIPEAIELGSRIAVMTPRPGHIEKLIENKMPRPRKQRSQEFFDLEDELYRLIKP
jgi:ABC-type nitrate/sulfonate/bicarbonate transport system ATPase subunit